MASKQQKSASKSGQSVLVNVEKITTSVKTEDIQLLSDMVEAEIGDHRLSQEELEQLQNLMSVDAVEAKKWRTRLDSTERSEGA